MKKKLSLILCLCFMVLGLTACGEDPTSVEYFGKSYDEMQTIMEQEATALVNLNDEARAYTQIYGSELSLKLVESWDEAVAGLDDYQGLGEFTITKTQDTITAEQVIQYTGRDVIITYVYEYNYEVGAAELTDVNVDKVYTLGEKMTKAALNTLMGMGTVFVVLILISLIIYCFRLISVIQDKLADRKSGTAKAEDAVVEQIGQREEQQLIDNLELVAVISAAIAASEGTSTEGFVVRSIHRR